jgi:hypothetical protein
MPSSFETHAEFGAGPPELILVRGTEVLRRSHEVGDSAGELGQPVSVRWTDEYLRAVLPELTSISNDRFETAKGLALYSGGIRVGFSKHGRRIGLLAFLENSRLADALLPDEEVDPELGNMPERVTKRTSGEGHKGSRVRDRKKLEVAIEPPQLFDQGWLTETTESKTKRRIRTPRFVDPRILAELEREERLHCATELVLEIAEQPDQLAFGASLVRAEAKNLQYLSEDLRALCEYRETCDDKNSRPIARIAAHIHKLELERRNSPMVNSEKIELLRLAIKSKWVVSAKDLDHLSKVLSLVEADDSLGSLNFSEMSSWMQGFVMFFLHSASPQEVLGINQLYFQVSPEAMSIAAFLVGLRFARDSYKSDSVFMPLRDLCVRRAVEILNDCVDEGNNPSITVESGSVKIGGVKFVQARLMQVLELERCPVLVQVGRRPRTRLRAARIVLPLGKGHLPKTKFEEIVDWAKDITASSAESFHSLVWGSVLRIEKEKKSLLFLADFADYERMFVKHQAVRLKFSGLVWVIDTGGVSHLFNRPTLFISKDRMIEILNKQGEDVGNKPNTMGLKKSERNLLKRLPKKFEERRERLEIPEQ